MNTMSQPPCMDIEYWRSYRPFLSKKLQLIKIKSHHYCVTLLNDILCKKLSQWHHFQPQNHMVTAYIRMLIFINYLTVEDYYLKFPPSSSSKSGEYPFILRAVLFFSKDGFWAFANTCEGALIYHFYVFVLFNLVYFPRSAHL